MSEDISLHLVTRDGNILFVKPLPPSVLRTDDQDLVIPTDEKLRNVVLGFVLSYICMIKCEPDFRIALENHLLPSILCPESTQKVQVEKAFRQWQYTASRWNDVIKGLSATCASRAR